MIVADIVDSGGFQAIKLPKDFYVEGDKIFIQKVGDDFLLTPAKNTMNGMLKGIEMFTDDFMKDGRGKVFFAEREEF